MRIRENHGDLPFYDMKTRKVFTVKWCHISIFRILNDSASLLIILLRWQVGLATCWCQRFKSCRNAPTTTAACSTGTPTCWKLCAAGGAPCSKPRWRQTSTSTGPGYSTQLFPTIMQVPFCRGYWNRRPER